MPKVAPMLTPCFDSSQLAIDWHARVQARRPYNPPPHKRRPQMSTPNPEKAPRMRPIPSFIFASRWLQLPLYLGLIAAQGVYVFHFWVELVHLLEAAFGSETALQALIS